jgi:circadian clock protein KaiC
MSDRLPSGRARLDLVLGGGLPLYGINLVIGPPGTGKTILAEQYLFHNASKEQLAVYLSTVSEPLDKILRYGQSLTFFDKSKVGSSILYEDLGRRLNEEGLGGVLAQLTGLLREHRPSFVVIDSFKALRAYAPDEGSFRRFLHELAGQLSALPVTSFWVGEYEATQTTDAPEFAVADAIISLGFHRIAERVSRVIQVLKLRGSSFVAGTHAYRISPQGIDVFPRLADPREGESYVSSLDRTTSGVSMLDEMLADGFWRGSSTLVAGPSGSGKTLLGLHFAFSGARLGERCVFATLQESPEQLEHVLGGFSWSLNEPLIELMYRPPVDLYLDEWVYELLDVIGQTEATRVVIDSLGDLRAACSDELRFREYIYSLLQRCARRNISVLMTQEVPELFGLTRLSEYGISHLSDNVVLLQFLRGDSEIKRAISVLKTRASAHDPRIRQFEITSSGLSLGEQFLPEQDLT